MSQGQPSGAEQFAEGGAAAVQHEFRAADPVDLSNLLGWDAQQFYNNVYQ